MTESKTFVLPDLIKYCPFKFQINPHYEIAKVEAEKWLYSYGITNIEKVKKSSFPLLAAMTHDTLDAERVCVLANYYQWVFIYDDHFDNGIWSKSSEDARHIADLIINVMRDPNAFNQTSFVPAEMLRNIMLQINKTTTKTYQSHLVRYIQEYIDAAVEQVIGRAKNTDLNMDTYIELRRKTGAMSAVYDLIQYALDLDIPNEVMNDSTIEKLLLYCNDICVLSNDLYSFNIEQAWGETHNLVIITMARGHSIQQSIDFVGDLIKHYFDAYVAEKAKIPAWGSKIDQTVAIFLKAVEQWVIGFIQWSFATERYFGRDNEEIKKSRLVTILPRKV